ncbi:NADH-dependent butanol dehydrogenase B [Metalysinibacillus saudimassiliensis]|uniref:NADH-dependent butanol dehydrogenase B n=1 Tax=Metalysinibacillus saudimassiliensis TaxID=1461583 RepID=A0A078MMK6_9BACL|nr:NADH-dependent butanol dehydrogenase B [Metalysinibacillus saudimassiliensis]
MNDFTFYNPTKLQFGKQAVANHLATSLKPYQTILVVYGGGSIKRNGVYGDVMAVLQAEQKTIVELAGVDPNPRVTTANEGAALCKAHNVDIVLAVGGGSVIDCAKLIAAAAKYDGDAWDLVTRKAPVNEALPIGVVLTLAATGSEMNSGSVITNPITKEKLSWGSPLTFPKFSIMDPSYTFTVPTNHTVYGIVDIMSHTFEQYFNNATNTPITDQMAEGLLRTMIEVAPKVVKDPTNYELRETILLGGTIGLNGFLAIGSRGDWGSHNIEHAVSALHDIPHAGGLAILFPQWMRHVIMTNPERFAQIATRVWQVNPSNKTPLQVAEEGIDCLANFWTSLGAPSRLSDYAIDDSTFEQIADHAMLNGPFGNFAKLERDDVLQILHASR